MDPYDGIQGGSAVAVVATGCVGTVVDACLAWGRHSVVGLDLEQLRSRNERTPPSLTV